MYGMACRARARGKPARTDARDSDTWPAMSDALRGLLDGVRARLPSRPRRAVDPGAQSADPDDRLRRIRNGKAGPPGYAPGRMMADLFQARGYEIVSGCGSSEQDNGLDVKGTESYLVYESKGRRSAVRCCVGTADWSVGWLKVL